MVGVSHIQWYSSHTFIYSMLAERTCDENGEIRLYSGTNNASGRVEVCLDGLWGTVCDDGWKSNDATTVCRQLGYSGSSKIMKVT